MMDVRRHVDDDDDAHAKPHGAKRPAEDNLDHAQRLSKRFNLLNLDHKQHLQNSNYYIPVDGRSPPRTPALRDDTGPIRDDYMQLDDTKDKVFIRDLDEELADEALEDEDRLVFLSDIEKHLNSIPKHVLVGSQEKRDSARQMVLYSVPQSLSVPEEKDSVRKAIIESRARARVTQPQEENLGRISQDAMLHDTIDEPMQATVPAKKAPRAQEEDEMELD